MYLDAIFGIIAGVTLFLLLSGVAIGLVVGFDWLYHHLLGR